MKFVVMFSLWSVGSLENCWFTVRINFSCTIISKLDHFIHALLLCSSLWPITFLENWFKLIFRTCLKGRIWIVIHSKFACRKGLYDYNATIRKLIFIKWGNDRKGEEGVSLKHMHRVTIIQDEACLLPRQMRLS